MGITKRRKPSPLRPYLALILCLHAASALAISPKEVYQKAGPGVVFILASDGSQMGSVGTGSIIRADGLVITNAHVLMRPGALRPKPDIAVFLKPRKLSGDYQQDLIHRYKAQVLAYDADLDLALLKITGAKETLTTVPFADSTEVVVGDQVYAIGHPEQGGLWSLTTGVISAYRQNYGGIQGKDLFQTDASINRGNSGGPLLNTEGDMVGINSMIARKAEDGLTITDVNFSIQAQVALNWMIRSGYAMTAKPAASQPSSAAGQPRPETPSDGGTVQTSPPAEPPRDDTGKNDPAQSGGIKEKTSQPPAEKPEKPAEPVTPPAEPGKESGPSLQPDPPKGGEKLITPKRPYKESQLLRDMQEMEDMMDEMRNKIRNRIRKN